MLGILTEAKYDPNDSFYTTTTVGSDEWVVELVEDKAEFERKAVRNCTPMLIGCNKGNMTYLVVY